MRVTRPQIPGTYWTSTPWWRALRSCIFVYGLLSLLFTKLSLCFFLNSILLSIYSYCHAHFCSSASRCAVYRKYGSKFCIVLLGSTTVQILEPLLRFYSKLWHKIGSRVEISEPQYIARTKYSGPALYYQEFCYAHNLK